MSLDVDDRPCSSCPYRVDTPSGVWAPEEYEKLIAYDGEMWEQPAAVFLCHHSKLGRARDVVCRGWLSTVGFDGLAVRLALANGTIDPEQVEPPVDLPLHPSGHVAAAFGRRDIAVPGHAASAVIQRIVRAQDRGRS